MDRRRKVELFEQIRREYRFGVGTIRGVAKQYGVHRRIVRQAMASALPPEHKVPMRSLPKLEPVKEFIDEILLAQVAAGGEARTTGVGLDEIGRIYTSDAYAANAQRQRTYIGISMCSDLLIYLSPSAPVSCDRGSTGLSGAVGAPG
jgi:hypothetical protein